MKTKEEEGRTEERTEFCSDYTAPPIDRWIIIYRKRITVLCQSCEGGGGGGGIESGCWRTTVLRLLCAVDCGCCYCFLCVVPCCVLNWTEFCSGIWCREERVSVEWFCDFWLRTGYCCCGNGFDCKIHFDLATTTDRRTRTVCHIILCACVCFCVLRKVYRSIGWMENF